MYVITLTGTADNQKKAIGQYPRNFTYRKDAMRVYGSLNMFGGIMCKVEHVTKDKTKIIAGR